MSHSKKHAQRLLRELQIVGIRELACTTNTIEGRQNLGNAEDAQDNLRGRPARCHDGIAARFRDVSLGESRRIEDQPHQELSERSLRTVALKDTPSASLSGRARFHRLDLCRFAVAAAEYHECRRGGCVPDPHARRPAGEPEARGQEEVLNAANPGAVPHQWRPDASDRTERSIVVLLVWLVVIGTSIWVLVDARSIGVERGQLKGLAYMTPLEWFGCCLTIWPIGVLFYLAKREELKRISAARG